MACLDNQHQPHRRFLQLHRRLRVGELGAVNNVGPVNQVLEVRHRIVEHRPRHVSDEFRARLVTGIVKFVAARVTTKMSLILRGKERALMMIEPPRQLL